MRILMLTWHYPPAVGGSEKQAERMAHAFVDRGHSVEIWTATRPDAPPQEEPRPGLVIRRFCRGLEIGPLFGLTVLLQMRAAVRREAHRFDVMHAHHATWGAIGAALARSAAPHRVPPLLVMLASSGPLNDVAVLRARKGGAWLVPALDRGTRTFVALCRSARAELAPLGIDPAKVRLIPNGIDLESYRRGAPAASAAVARAAGSGPVVLYVGRLHAIKGADILVRAVARLRDRAPRPQLWLVGDGAERPRLVALARELGLSHADADPGTATPAADVLFWGMQGDTRPFLLAADAVVLPSRTEGMSNVLIEAMAMESRIVATAVGGNPDLLDPADASKSLLAAGAADDEVFALAENGALATPEQVSSLAGALAWMLDPANAEANAAMARRARAHVEKVCAMPAVIDAYLATYEEMRRG